MTIYNYTISVTDVNGLVATLADEVEVFDIACGVDLEYNGASVYPAEYEVYLGAGTGVVEFTYATGGKPDKFQVIYDGVTVIDPGYVGDTDEQANLDAALALYGDPSETITQRSGSSNSDAPTQWATEWERDWATFTKSTTTQTATVRVYGPIDTTLWNFAISCPGTAPWTPKHLSATPDIWLSDLGTATDAGSGACSLWGDISGNGYDALQSSSVKRPAIQATGINSLRSIRFDGTLSANGDRMTSATAGAKAITQNVTGAWLFAVYKKQTTDGSPQNRVVARINSGDGSSQYRLQILAGRGTAPYQNYPASSARRLDADSDSILTNTEARTDWVMALVNVDFAGRTHDFYIDGELVATDAALSSAGGSTSNTASDSGLVLAATSSTIDSSCGDVEIATVMLTGGAVLSATEIDYLFGYAAHRYGLTASLAVDHPYKTDAPTL